MYSFILRKTIEKVIYFMLLERKERSPTHEDSAVAAIKNLKEICKGFLKYFTFTRHLPALGKRAIVS